MKRLLLVIFVLAAACTALAEANQRRSPAGEPPVQLRQGRARAIGHLNPHQTLRLAFGLKPPYLVEEEQFLQELMTPGSPNFHKFLTPDEWNARFAPSVADEQAVLDWATSEGLTITHRYPNRLIVDVEAPVASIERSLRVTINSYAFQNYSYFSNEREPALPAEIAGIVHSIGGLTNFPEMRPAGFHGAEPPGPVYRPGPVVAVGQTVHAHGDGTRRLQGLMNSRQANDTPSFTNNFIDPKDIYNSNAYNYDALQNFGFCCNPNHLGGGAPKESSIALATFGNLHLNGSDFTDILGFHNQYPYLAYNVTTVIIDGGPGSCTVTSTQPCANDGETALDTEWATATSNSFGSYLDTAQVWVYQDGGSTEDMYNAILNDDHARTFSTSWDCSENGSCISGSAMDTRHNIFNNMVGLGWTLLNSSGDRGATADCSASTGTLSVNYPASDPDVIGVGGTANVLYNPASYNNEVAWTGSTASGSCSTNGGGSGGGCSVHFAVPGYQSGSNGSCGTQRSVPDIALNAAEGQNYYFNGALSGVGGTSISSPMLAGFFAQEEAYLLHLKNVTGNNCGLHGPAPGAGVPCGPIGNGNYYLYYFGQKPSYAPHYPFYDIIVGCNSNDITVANGLTAFCAGVGYDSVTGWGSGNMLQLAWAINTFIGGDFGAPSVSFSGPAPGSWHNTNQTVSWTISDTSGNGAVPIGVAGFSKNWDSDVGDDAVKATPGTGSSYYSGPQVPLVIFGSLLLDNSREGMHTVHVRAWDNGGSTSDNTYGPVGFDDIPPSAACASPDGAWHATDVSLHCTAGDTLSGLASVGDASFNLTTSVPAGTDNSNAFTNSRTIFDVAGNSTTEGPLGPNKVDKKPPVIAIVAPTATQYTHSSTLTLNYSVTDGIGSGVGSVTPTMNGSGTVGGSTIVNGLAINLLTALPLGSNTFAVGAADNVGNTNSASVTFTIIVTAQSMIDDVNQFKTSGAISDPAVYSGLLDKLNQAASARSKGQCKTANNVYSAFINQVLGQIGKGITPAAGAILIADAQYLMAHCP
jgi:hypothetical protein